MAASEIETGLSYGSYISESLVERYVYFYNNNLCQPNLLRPNFGQRFFRSSPDLGQGRLLWVGEDRTEATLKGFFAWLGPERARQLDAVCLDMWAPYAWVIERHALQAGLGFDRFHLIRHLNTAVDEVRRAEVRRLTATRAECSRAPATSC